MKTQEKDQQREEAIKALKKMGLKPGKLVYTILRKVSSSGMSRQISVCIAGSDGKILNIDWYVERILNYKRSDNNGYGLKIGGCGMDMGFHLVYSLGRALYPDGFKLAKNQFGRNGDKSGFDTDGGYSLKQEWL